MIDLTSLQGSRFLVLGYGLSGKSATMTLRAADKNVCIFDDNKDKMDQAKIDGFQISDDLTKIDCLVVSPGVIFHGEKTHPMIKQARDLNIDITNDVGLFRRAKPDANIIGITGTNGKSTTTALIGHILKDNNINVAVGGNLGTPTLDLDNNSDWYVLELSSYQLESMDYLKPDTAILLNITTDHIDHHGSMENYTAAKERIFEGARHSIYGTELEYQSGLYQGHGMIEFDRLKGEHNWQNIACAFEACRQVGVSSDDIWVSVASFEGLPHRQFKVRQINHVTYINDSKATNINATLTAIKSFENIHLIAGGLPKEGGLNGLEKFKSKINHIYLIGEAQDQFAQFCQNHEISFTKCHEMEKALKLANDNAQNDKNSSVILLSPAAASFDQYPNFSLRGDHFTKLVNAL